MTEAIEGGCRCGRVRYRVKVPQLPSTYACHYRDCQTWSGSAFSLQFISADQDFELHGETEFFELRSADGKRISYQYACPACFSRIYNTNTGRPGMAVVRAGTLDRSDELKIVAHIWTERKLTGITIPRDIPTWSRSAPPIQLAAALAP